MSLITIPSISSNWTPLSASYELDPYIQLITNQITTADGYKVFNQKIFFDPQDGIINKNTIFYLPTADHLLNFLYDKGKENLNTGGYIRIKVNVGSTTYYFSANENKQIILSPDENKALYIRTNVNTDGSLTFFTETNKFITISKYEPFLVYLAPSLPGSEKYRQEFYYSIENEEDVTIYTKPTLGLSNKRLWGYRTSGPNAFIVRANGFIGNTDINPSVKYIFKIPNFENVIRYNSAGLSINHHFVTYHNNLNNKINNKNVNLKDKTPVKIQHLVDFPYHTADYTNNKAPVNIANLKNVMTETYKYNYSTETTTTVTTVSP